MAGLETGFYSTRTAGDAAGSVAVVARYGDAGQILEPVTVEPVAGVTLTRNGEPVEYRTVRGHVEGRALPVERMGSYQGHVIIELTLGVTVAELVAHGLDLNDYVQPAAYGIGYRLERVRMHSAYGIAAPAPVIEGVPA